MRKNNSMTLYIFWLSILAIGGLMFLFRGQIVSYLGKAAITPSTDANLLNSVKKNNQDSLNLSILDDKRFVNLKNQTADFNFDNFNENSVIGSDGTLVTNFGTSSTSTEGLSSSTFKVLLPVTVGNNSPFSRTK